MSHDACDLRQPQLFLDDTWIADSGRLQRTWHQALKYPDPVIAAEHPWEYNCPVAYGSILHWQGSFHAWYCGWTKQVGPMVCYATSDDGIHWRKPALGLVEFQGSRDNNLLLRSRNPDPRQLIDDLTVIADPGDARYPLKMLYFDSDRGATGSEPHGIHAAGSADGLRWESFGQVLPEWGDRFNALGQRLGGEFLAFARAPGMRTSGHGRVASRLTSPDLLHWSEAELVLKTDLEDAPNAEIYSVVPFLHGDLLLGGIERMHMTPDKLDTELAWSRDRGRTWQRARTRPSFIPWGLPGRWDDTWINLSANQPILHDGRLWFYYSGRTGAHDAQYPHNHGAIGLATLRRDGFCSLRATEQTGWCNTPAFTWPGGDLWANVDCRRDDTSHPGLCTGEFRVEVQTPDGQPLPGFGGTHLKPISQNTYRDKDARVRWEGDRSLDQLKGQTIRLRFLLRDAHLYAFRAAAVEQP